jgi:glycosidase
MSSETISKNFSWIENRKIYQVFTDRFAGHKSNPSINEMKYTFIYGNLKALIKKLDYIKSLNFNMIWITPFFVNQPKGYHGYHVINFNHCDPKIAFGENPEDNDIGNNFDPNDLEKITKSDKVVIELLEECHKRDIKVMIDFVPNHVYKTHPFFLDAKQNKEKSKYYNWFYFLSIDEKRQLEINKKFILNEIRNNQNIYTNKNNNNMNNNMYRDRYLSFLGIDDLPKLNLENEECITYIIIVLKKWLKLGFDAVRIDHCIGPSIKSLTRIKNEIHKDFPNVPLIGECLPWGCVNSPYTILSATYEQLVKTSHNSVENIPHLDELFLQFYNVLDGLIDFSFQGAINLLCEDKINENEFLKIIEEHYDRFKNKEFILLKSIDNHDTNRIMFKCKDNVDKVKLAIDLLFRKYKGRCDPLIMYYGTEDFMTHDRDISSEPYGDYRCRLPMKFKHEFISNFFKAKKE